MKLAAGATARTVADVVGVGLTRIGESYAIKVNLANSSALGSALPGDIDGVPIIYEVTGPARKQVIAIPGAARRS